MRSRSRSPRGGRGDRERERSRSRGRDDRAAEGRLREDDRGGLYRAGGRGGVSGTYDSRGPPPEGRGFGSRGAPPGGGYQRGGRAMIGPPGVPPPIGGRWGRVEDDKPVDREKQCPMLIRIFCKFGEHHREEDFSYTQQPVEDEVLVHTWRDATLAELTELLAQEHREVRQSETKCTFKVVFPNSDGKWMSRHLGSTAIGRRLHDDISTQTLAQVRFQVGDFMSVAIYPPRSSMAARAGEGKEGRGGEAERDAAKKELDEDAGNKTGSERTDSKETEGDKEDAGSKEVKDKNEGQGKADDPDQEAKKE